MDGDHTGEHGKWGAWGKNIAPKTLHVLVGGMFWGLNFLCIKTCVGLHVETSHVSVGDRF